MAEVAELKKHKAYDETLEKLGFGDVDLVTLPTKSREYNGFELDIRLFVRMRIDAQLARIRMGNQIFQNFRIKTGLSSNQPTSDDKEVDKLLKQLTNEYSRITDNLIQLSLAKKKKFFKTEEGIISNYYEYNIISEYMSMLEREKRIESNMGDILSHFPIYTKCMTEILGVGPVIAGSLLAFVDIYKSESVSAFWRFCGCDVRKNGQGSSKMYPRKNENGEENDPHNYVIQEYIDTNGELNVKRSLGYGTFLKSKLLGVLPGNILKHKAKPHNYYAPIFYNSRKMYQNHPNHKWKSPLHIQRMANRKMIQTMLMHIWICWRSLEGLDIKAPYHERVLGQTHKGNTQLEICKELYPGCF